MLEGGGRLQELMLPLRIKRSGNVCLGVKGCNKARPSNIQLKQKVGAPRATTANQITRKDQVEWNQTLYKAAHLSD
jgi:hypothetical protein